MLKQIRNICMFAVMVISLFGCQETKCVKPVDTHGKTVVDAIVTFSAIKEVNVDQLGGMVTSFFPFYKVDVGKVNMSGNICFHNYKKKDSYFLYVKMRRWSFHASHLEKNYYDFESIPTVVKLEEVTGSEK